jgi:hypothetical protein
MLTRSLVAHALGFLTAAAAAAAAANTAVIAGPDVSARSARPDGSARRELALALSAMGGRKVLSSIHALRFQAVGHRNMLEQSLRPEGPWWQDYIQLDETRDFDHDSERVIPQHRGYSSPQWWLQHPQWDGAPVYPAYIVSGGVVAQIVDGKYAPASFRYLQESEEDFAFGPLRILFTALSASDVRALPDVQLHGYDHHVVGFTWHGYPVRLYLNSYTMLPEVVEWTAPRPYDVFWNVWGDVTIRITYGMWSLEPNGLRFPRQWTVDRNGLPDSDISITSLTLNPALGPGGLTLPESAHDETARHRRTIAQIPLGIPGQQPAEIAPGVLSISGAWNVSLIRQPDGVIVLEGPISSDYSIRLLDEAHRRFPRLPIKAVITTSDSWPHIGGLREYVARGIPIYTLDLDRPVLTRLFDAPHTFIPDDLQKHRRPPRWHLVKGRTTLGTGPTRVELIPYRTETGERQMMVYLPDDKLLYTSDLFAPDEKDTWFTPEYLLELRRAVARERLDVHAIFGMHYGVTPYAVALAALNGFLEPHSKAVADDRPSELKGELQRFSFFDGSWSCHGVFPSSGKTIDSAERFAPDLQGQWLGMRHIDQPPFAFHALEMWRYDSAGQRFDNYVFDSASGLRHYVSPGWSGDKLVWTLADQTNRADRFVFWRKDTAHYQVDYLRGASGRSWVTVDTLRCERQAGTR